MMSEEQLKNGKKMDGVFTPTKQRETSLWRQRSLIIIYCLRKVSKQYTFRGFRIVGSVATDKRWECSEN
jgi:hypothetical protein